MYWRDMFNIKDMNVAEAVKYYKKSNDVKKELQIAVKTIRDELL